MTGRLRRSQALSAASGLTASSQLPCQTTPAGATAQLTAYHYVAHNVIYAGCDGRLKDLVNLLGVWVGVDLNVQSNYFGASALGPVSSYVDSAGNAHVISHDSDNRVHEFYTSASGWHHDNLLDASAGHNSPYGVAYPIPGTAAQGGTPISSVAINLGIGGFESVYYFGANGHVEQFFRVTSGQWYDNDLSVASGLGDTHRAAGMH